jgi:hypothetical protein
MPSKYKRKSLIRDPYKKIVIAMEGNRTEPFYFREAKKKFRSSTVKVELLTRDESDTRSAPVHVIEQLNSYRKNNRLLDTDELWLVIDRDRWPEEQLHDVSTRCSTSRYHLSVSNPCFEIWLVLHYEDLTDIGDTDKETLSSSRNTRSKWSEINSRERIGSYSQIIEKIDTAITYARNLDRDQTTRWPNSIGSRVYRLAVSIIEDSQ